MLDVRSRRCSLGQAMAEIEDEDDWEEGEKEPQIPIFQWLLIG
jgi:hypothetical protein